MATLTAVPSRLDLHIYAGDGFSARFTFTDQTTGAPFPPTGDWLAQVRTTDVGDVVATFTIDLTDAAAGILTVALTAVDTAAIAVVSPAVWDLQQTEPGGEPRTWFRGDVRSSRDVTR